MGAQELLDKTITERVDQILGRRISDLQARYYEEQEAILRGLDRETREKFERFLDSMVAGGAEECRAVYRAAFLDGLWLAHKAF